jgi:hypothetical protein
MDAFREKSLLLVKRITPILFSLTLASYRSIFELLPEQFAVPVKLPKDIFGVELWYLQDEVTRNRENYIMRSLMCSTPHPVVCR